MSSSYAYIKMLSCTAAANIQHKTAGGKDRISMIHVFWGARGSLTADQHVPWPRCPLTVGGHLWFYFNPKISKLHTSETWQGSKPKRGFWGVSLLKCNLIWIKIHSIHHLLSSDATETNSYLLPIDVTGCYCNHGGFSYKTSEKGSYSKSGSMNSVGGIERKQSLLCENAWFIITFSLAYITNLMIEIFSSKTQYTA